jgi:hypothetical protein
MSFERHFVRRQPVLVCSRERLVTPDAQHGLGSVQQCLIIQSRVSRRQSFQAVNHLPELIIWFPACYLERFYHRRIVRVHITMIRHVAPVCFHLTYISLIDLLGTACNCLQWLYPATSTWLISIQKVTKCRRPPQGTKHVLRGQRTRRQRGRPWPGSALPKVDERLTQFLHEPV